jgi:hypothetical protein
LRHASLRFPIVRRFAALIARFDDEETAAFIARDSLHQALGSAMPPDALELAGYLPDAFPVAVN